MSDEPRDTVPDGLHAAPVSAAPAAPEPAVSSGPAVAAVAAVASHAGALLKAERERAGLHIGALAVALKVPVAKLEALESGAMEQSTSPVFVRALAASVCRQLKIDPEPILSRLPQAKHSPLKKDEDLDAPFPTGGSHNISSMLPFNWRSPIAWAVMALLVGAAALVYWPSGRFTTSMTSTTSEQAVTPAEPGASGTAPVAAGSDVSAAAPAASVPAVVDAAPAAAGATTTSAPTVAAPAAPVTSGSGTAPAAAAPAAAPSNDLLVLRASQSSWIEVTDARGAVVMRKTLEAGETATPTGTAPLKVIVGNAKFTQAWVNGQGVDLAPLTRDNVARFDAK